MLAAFGFFYTTVGETIGRGLDTEEAPANADAAASAIATICRARRAAATLALVASSVFALLASYLAHELQAAAAAGLSPSHYSTLDAIFVALALGWVGIAIIFILRTITLTTKLSTVKRNTSKL